MIAKVLGVQKVDFTADDGKRVVGTKLYICYKSSNPYIDGEVAKDIFVNSLVDVSKVRVGKSYDFIYNTEFGSKAKLVSIDEVYNDD